MLFLRPIDARFILVLQIHNVFGVRIRQREKSMLFYRLSAELR